MAVTPPIPTGEWDKTDLLAFEREMLGLYVSDHPLFGARARAGRAPPTCRSPRSPRRAPSPTARCVTLAGILSGVQRRITKQGRAWASATLEDLDGAVEVLFFPNTYELVGQYIAEDAIVVVKGRVDRRDDQPRMMAMDLSMPDITAPDDEQAGRAGPAAVPVHAAAGRAAQGGAGQPSRRGRGAPQAGQRQRATLLRLGPLRVAPTTALMADLKALLGPGVDAADRVPTRAPTRRPEQDRGRDRRRADAAVATLSDHDRCRRSRARRQPAAVEPVPPATLDLT